MNILLELQRRGIDIRENSFDPTELKICCPFCVDMGFSPDYRYRFGFNIVNGMGHCFNCNWSTHHAVVDLVKKFNLGDDVLSEVRLIPFTNISRKRPDKPKLPEGFQLLSEVDVDDELFGVAKKYVYDRGITDRQIKEHEIGATVLDRQQSHRIIFPVRGIKDKLLGVVGRDWIGNRNPKYLNSEGTKGVINCRPDKFSKRMVILSEGITKALAIERATRFKICSAAPCGNHVTDVHVNMLKAFKEVVLFPDPDIPGITGFLNAARKLVSVVKIVSFVWPWPTKQADDMDPKEIREVIRNRRVYSQFLGWKFRKEMRNRV